METIAVHTRLVRGREDDYDSQHERVPEELAAALREAGVRDWRIWRSGQELFHLIECDDYRAMRLALRDHPANIPWQKQMSELLEVGDSYEGDDSGLRRVWALTAQLETEAQA